jgi:hypothetical protein
MGDDEANGPNPHDPVPQAIRRLYEVHRRLEGESAANGSRAAAGRRLESVLESLARVTDGDEDLDRAAINTDLVAIETLLDGSGLPALARVVSSVRDSVTASPGLGDAAADDPPPPRRFRPPPVRRVVRPRPTSTAEEPAPATGRRPVMTALMSVWVIALMAVVGYGVVRSWHRSEAESGLKTPEVDEPRQSATTPADDPAPLPTLAPWVPDPEEQLAAYERHLAVVAEQLDLARTALDADDADSALRHFLIATAADRYHRRVVDMAPAVIDQLLAAADLARADGAWEVAEARIGAARGIAERFYLETDAIEAAAERLATTSRFQDLNADETAAIRAAVGRDVRVTLSTGDTFAGLLAAFDGGALSLMVRSDVSGGEVQFARDVDLERVEQIRVYQSPPSRPTPGSPTP